MKIRNIVRSVLAAAAVVTLAGPAAADYTPTGTVAVSDSTPAPGQSVTVSGSGYAALSQVTVTLGALQTVLTTVLTDGTGAFSTTVTIPSTVSGTQTIRSTGLNPVGSTRVLATDLNVGGTALPTTGSDTTVLLIAGGVVVVVGAGLVATSRRRSSVG